MEGGDGELEGGDRDVTSGDCTARRKISRETASIPTSPITREPPLTSRLPGVVKFSSSCRPHACSVGNSPARPKKAPVDNTAPTIRVISALLMGWRERRL